jgi:hypothetical protein
MNRLWLLGLLALVVAVPLAALYAAEGDRPRGEGDRERVRAEGDRPRGDRPPLEGRRPDGPPPPMNLTPEQKEAVEGPTKEFADAVRKFQEAAIGALGERAGRAYVMQTFARLARPAGPPPGEGDRVRGEGDRVRGEGDRVRGEGDTPRGERQNRREQRRDGPPEGEGRRGPVGGDAGL